jgi:hypothetical protein
VIQKKDWVNESFKGYFVENFHQSRQISRTFIFFEIAIFRQWVSANLKILLKILLSSLTCSQNWLIPLADDSKV